MCLQLIYVGVWLIIRKCLLYITENYAKSKITILVHILQDTERLKSIITFNRHRNF